MSQSSKKNREMVFAEDGQTYACVTKMLGHCRLLATTVDGRDIRCKIRGSMQKRVYVNPGDWVLVASRTEIAGDFDDVIAKYAPSEIAYLRRIGEIIDVRPAANDDDAPVDDDVVDFADDDIDII